MIKILLLLSLLLFGCSRENDGPIPIYNDDDLLASGEGFYYAGALDFNYPIHILDDTLVIYLDSIWTFSNCSLKEIQFEKSLIKDTLLVLRPRFIIEPSGKDCAAPLFRPETTISFLLASYEHLREVRLLNTEKKEVDSILVREGSLLKEKQNFYVDSAMANPTLWPFRLSGENGDVLRILDSIKTTSYYWKSIVGECKKVQESCGSLKPDTLFPSSRWDQKDTVLIPVIQVCKDTSKTYCLKKDWVYDSLKTGKLNALIDTTWRSSFYYIAPIKSCSKLISLTVLSELTLKKIFSLQTDIFVPSSKEKDCEETLIPNKIIYDLGNLENVQDLQKAKALLDQLDSAHVGITLEQEK